MDKVDAWAGIGLSPRVRGKRCCGRGLGLRSGSIPACAGEAVAAMAGPGAIVGLSPRVRGKLEVVSSTYAQWRSIPACAGEAPANPSAASVVGVYPRVCGGSQGIGGRPVHHRGLSPRVRGKLDGGGVGVNQDGSIPACAGEA